MSAHKWLFFDIGSTLIDEKEANNKLITEEFDAWKEPLSKEDTNK